MDCNIIKDLMPLYIDDCCSEESAKLVKEHINTCPACRDVYESMSAVSDAPSIVSAPTKFSRVNDWRASVLQSVLLFISFAMITVGVALESATPLGLENGFWAWVLVVPATGFLLSLANWYFVRLYKSRRVFSNCSCLATLSITICAYIWGGFHYGLGEIDFIGCFEGFHGIELFNIILEMILVLCSIFRGPIFLTALFCVLSKFFFVCLMLFPCGIFLAGCSRYTFELANVPVFAMVLAFLAVSMMVVSVICHEIAPKKSCAILCSLSAPFALINAVLYLLECSSILVAVSMFLCAVCCFYLAIKWGKPRLLKCVSLVIAGLMILPVSFVAFLSFLLGDFSKNTIVQTIDSPAGTYYAQIVESNQGALGGTTFVEVYEYGGIHALIFNISKKPQKIYSGPWGAFEGMQIYWKDENCLMINQTEYKMQP